MRPSGRPGRRCRRGGPYRGPTDEASCCGSLRFCATNAEELAEIAVLDNGAPHLGALGGVYTAADHFEYFAGWADKLEGAVIPVWPGEALDYTLREPYGVLGLIIPFNGPLVSMGLRVAPALATGNTVVLKPSEFAPYGPLRFAQLCAAAGVPPGVFNVIPGDGSTGQALVEHPGVDKIHFTGSVPTARDVLTRAAHTIKPVALELGGKSANIVFADADLDQAAGMAVIASVVAMSGQTCICPSRLLVEASIYDDFVERVVTQAEAVAIGDPFASGTLMGPVISEAACQRILGVIEQGGREQAGTLLTGGTRAGGDLANGYFVLPTIFGEVDNNSSLARNEIFGPVLAAMRFEDEAHAVSLANDTDYGLAGYVHTADMKRGHRMAAALDAGYLSINGWAMMPPGAPFGGNRRSGIGRLGGRAGPRRVPARQERLRRPLARSGRDVEKLQDLIEDRLHPVADDLASLTEVVLGHDDHRQIGYALGGGRWRAPRT